MALNRNDLNMIRQYLLGALPEEEQQIIEQRLLTEDDLYQDLDVVEDELVDEYVSKELPPAEHDRFENYFLSTPERERELNFARALHRYTAKKTNTAGAKDIPVPPVRVTWLEGIQLAWARQAQLVRSAAVAAAIVIIVAALWFRPQPKPQSFATVALTMSNSNRGRGAEAKRVRLPLGADALRLYLKLPEQSAEATRYRVELLNENGETRSIERVGRDGQSIVAEIPAAQLTRGQYAFNVYVVKSDGTEQRIGGSYFLTVE
jgi:anti-sigma-K factor RskA